MTDEFDKGFPHCLANDRMGGNDISNGGEWEQDTDSHNFQGLEHHIFSTETGQAFVPDGGQGYSSKNSCRKNMSKLNHTSTVNKVSHANGTKNLTQLAAFSFAGINTKFRVPKLRAGCSVIRLQTYQMPPPPPDAETE
ncbi:hypothetical protein GWI33_012853 [Rhynchophorus ferrugineus]|uniref:Uncharacterized protein n=1 Tax=Rhynchophorus ferrugineus TaxID=354439 RepID=A0A834M775_RHYFE|nr:hypothetical protein GWI33_012853 [Rhynchophorus ferrugineus]